MQPVGGLSEPDEAITKTRHRDSAIWIVDDVKIPALR